MRPDQLSRFVFVETLDRCFKNVCELHIVFNFNKAGETVKHNQPHTEVDFRAFQPMSRVMDRNFEGLSRRNQIAFFSIVVRVLILIPVSVQVTLHLL
ncbi:Os01g0353666 [Oryza sativa Japonica Group]|uniref:Os01g0353666 protein n=1 Tax=Oryza sativa subsp. japonica TaxID=39947 RepID=C7IXZ6_ORYSJ|nr:Os01g0353666 [Oryza sativa Japonica Group]|eukprot:NP_001172328.1 Os01g0353666 [Oryza sativa Japonica Group]